MHLVIWDILAVNAAVHQGWCLHKQVALEQKCRFEANAVMILTCCRLARGQSP